MLHYFVVFQVVQGSWEDVSNDSHKFPFVEKSSSRVNPVLGQARYARGIASQDQNKLVEFKIALCLLLLIFGTDPVPD